MGWNLSDLKGIDPSLCTNRIFQEEDSRPSIEAQRRLNPKVWVAVKDEILKWLNAGIICPISDSPWVLVDRETRHTVGKTSATR